MGICDFVDHMQRFGILALWLASLSLHSCRPELPAEVAPAYEDLPTLLDYNIHVKPVLADKCFACHGPDKGKQKAGLRLDIPEVAFASLPESPGKVAIDPGDLNGSELFHRIISTDPEYKMPLPESHLSLSSLEKAILIKWIEDGAKYKPHWAFVKPKSPDVPKVSDEDWVINPIDNFILDKLEHEKLSPSPQAHKEL